MNSRKILIAAIVVLIIIVGVGLYFLFAAPKAATVGGSTGTGQTGSLPNAGNQSNGANGQSGSTASSTALGNKFGMISNEPVLDYFVNATNTVTAIEPSGKIIQVASGQVTTINALTMQNVLGASFSYNGAKVLVNFGDPADPQTSVFDIASQAWTALPAGMQSPAWSPTDYRIAYSATNLAQGTETFGTVDASKAKPMATALTTLHAQDLAVVWPGKNEMVFYTKPSAYVAGSAWTFNPATAALAPIAFETPGLAMLWSGSALAPTAPMELEFSSGGDALGGSLALADANGNITQQLKFLTLPSKCLFASATSTMVATSTPYLYCGVPRDSQTLSITPLPDGYNQMALFTSDNIEQINLQNGAINTIFNDQTQNMDLSDVKLFNGTLFFVNRYDQKLYGIQF